MLSIKLAEEIVKQTSMRLHYNINVIDLDGVILASGEKNRIDSLHDGALEVVRSQQVVIIEENQHDKYPNCKPGINLPLTYNERIVGVIGITGKPKELGEIAQLVQLTTEMIIHQAFMETESEWQQKNSELLVKALLETTTLTPTLLHRINKLPFPLVGPFHFLLIEETTMTASNKIYLKLEEMLYRQPVLFGQLNLTTYYILLGNTYSLDQFIKKLPKIQQLFHVQIGISMAIDEISMLKKAYEAAKFALAFSQQRQTIVTFDEIEVYTLLQRKKSEQVAIFLQKTVEQLDDKLIYTLKKFFECNLEISTAAKELDIHRHTLSYRLKKVERLIGYNPQSFEDASIIQLAFLLAEQPM
ncbi:MAG: sugar diacid recognition domain-containing protein [Solibacillus sp.]